MIRFKFYRWIFVTLGARSFVKDGDIKTYILIRGGSSKIINNLVWDGFVEEWPYNEEVNK